MKKLNLLLALLFIASTIITAKAQIPYSKGRIAMSSDGNFADEDDWGATPIALMMIAKTGLQDKFVLYTYADHVWQTGWGDHGSMLPHIKESVMGAKERWNFNTTNFIEAVTTPELAYNAMRDEINASTADNPLIIICAGPMHVVGEGLNRANTESLQYVTLISHSTWNDNHAIEPFEWENIQHNTWSWNNMKTSFPTANFVHINDQNQAGNPNAGFNTNLSGAEKGDATAWSYWDWMKDSSDESLNWAYERMQLVGRADASDAGMTWYALHGSEGNPTLLKDFIGASVLGAESANGLTLGSNYVVFEGEEATLTSEWALRIKGDDAYEKYVYFPTEGIAPANDTYIEHLGGSNTSLRYTFTCPKTGTYQLAMRMHSPLIETSHDYKTIIVNGQSMNVEKDDKRNDVFIRMEGNFQTAMENYSTEDLKNNEKFYGRGPNKWGNCYKLEHKGHLPPKYSLTKGEEYTLVVTGRSKGTSIDYIVLYDVAGVANITLNDQDLALQLPDRYRPGAVTSQPEVIGCDEIKAVDFDTYTGLSGFDDAATGMKNGVEFLQIITRDGQAAAQYTYDGIDRDVFFKINTLLEIDGEPNYTLKVNGNIIGTFTNPRTHNTSTPDYTIHSHTLNTEVYALKNGDIIQVEFDNVTNGFVKEGDPTAVVQPGDLTATARGRWHSIELCSDNEVVQVPASFTIEDQNQYKSNEFVIGGTMEVVLHYHAGTGNTVNSKHNGVKVFLREMTSSWGVVNDYIYTDPTVIGKESGTSTFSIPLDGLTPTTELPEGNFYFLFPRFENSAGESFKIDGLRDIKIIKSTATSTLNKKKDMNLTIFPNPANNTINIASQKYEEFKRVQIIDYAGIMKLNIPMSKQLDISSLSAGMYFIRLVGEGNTISKSFIKQ